MTKSQARVALDSILVEIKGSQGKVEPTMSLTLFVEQVYYPFYTRKWKRSTAANNINRVNTHVLQTFGNRSVGSFHRDELQDFLDAKTGEGLSFSMVDHLRWDLKQVFEMAVSEDLVGKNPAKLLFTPSTAKRGERLVMTTEEVQRCFLVLEIRDRLIAKLAIIAGMRPGEIFGLVWGRVGTDFADIRQRVYKGDIDTPKTNQSVRKAALSEGLIAELEKWKAMSIETGSKAWVFPSENLSTPMSRDNCLRRNISPRLESVGLSWVNFQVMRRTHSSLMKALGVDGKIVADQLGHSLDVNQNVYTQSPLRLRLEALERLETTLQIM